MRLRLLIPAAALAVAATACGSTPSQATPEGAVRAYFAALQSDKPAAACAFSADAGCGQRLSGLRRQDVVITGLKIGRAQIHLDTATVPTSVTSWALGDSSGGAGEQDGDLVRKAGKWYVS